MSRTTPEGRTMSHTPEPWVVYDDGKLGRHIIMARIDDENYDIAYLANVEEISVEANDANAARIVACVNGCTGLNPAAFREVVEALNSCKDRITRLEGTWEQAGRLAEIVDQALAHAEGQL